MAALESAEPALVSQGDGVFLLGVAPSLVFKPLASDEKGDSKESKSEGGPEESLEASAEGAGFFEGGGGEGVLCGLLCGFCGLALGEGIGGGLGVGSQGPIEERAGVVFGRQGKGRMELSPRPEPRPVFVESLQPVRREGRVRRCVWGEEVGGKGRRCGRLEEIGEEARGGLAGGGFGGEGLEGFAEEEEEEVVREAEVLGVLWAWGVGEDDPTEVLKFEEGAIDGGRGKAAKEEPRGEGGAREGRALGVGGERAESGEAGEHGVAEVGREERGAFGPEVGVDGFEVAGAAMQPEVGEEDLQEERQGAGVIGMKELVGDEMTPEDDFVLGGGEEFLGFGVEG